MLQTKEVQHFKPDGRLGTLVAILCVAFPALLWHLRRVRRGTPPAQESRRSDAGHSMEVEGSLSSTTDGSLRFGYTEGVGSSNGIHYQYTLSRYFWFATYEASRLAHRLGSQHLLTTVACAPSLVGGKMQNTHRGIHRGREEMVKTAPPSSVALFMRYAYQAHFLDAWGGRKYHSQSKFAELATRKSSLWFYACQP